MKYVLMDVEGTTTSISFVHDVLFPFSQKHLREFLTKNANHSQIQKIIEDTQHTVLKEEDKNLHVEDVIDQLLQWIQIDRKHPALKTLQGLIWKEGYESGEIKGHIYPEVKNCFKTWKDSGVLLGIYSSGSVEAQKLLFRHSIEGDLTGYLSHHFDTAIGHKRESQSYLNIANELKITPEDILFLSDIKEELDAAKAVGYNTIQLVRTSPIEFQGHRQIQNFLDIKINGDSI